VSEVDILFTTTKSYLSADGREERRKVNKNLLKYGVSFLDDLTGGISRTDLILLVGRSGQGKSELALHIASSNAHSGKKVYHLALEADSKEIHNRMLYKEIAKEYYLKRTFEPHISYDFWVKGYYEDLISDEIYNKAILNLEEKTINLKVFYRGKDFDLRELEKVFASAKADADLIVIDHIHYFDFTGNENEAQKTLMKTIRDLALQHNIPVIVVGHVRKQDRRNFTVIPDIEDVHGSSDIFKIVTHAIAIAPAVDIKKPIVGFGSGPTEYPSYIKIGKCRTNGSLKTYCGLMVYDVNKNSYLDGYKIGTTNSDGIYEESTNIPERAKNCINQIKNIF
jgi:archaellum biogenesis ATPase FlaH